MDTLKKLMKAKKKEINKRNMKNCGVKPKISLDQ